MPVILYITLGGVALSLFLSLFLIGRRSTCGKSDYERWIEEIRPQNVVKSRRTFSKV
jgi:hypothetical protein